MATEIILAGPATVRDTFTHAVYTRARWEDPWVLDPLLHCDEVVWSVAPSMPTATIHRYYGEIARPGALTFAKEDRSSKLRAYVKIVVTGQQGNHSWYGVIELEEDDLDGGRYYTQPGGTVTITPTGEQTFTAYGLEHLLAQLVIRTSIADDRAGGTETIGRGISFNADGKPNANAGKTAFAGEPDDLHWWSTNTIVWYLLSHQTPVDRDGVDRIIFSMAVADALRLPTWDHPQLEQHHQSVYDLLSSLIPRQRLMMWWLEVEEESNQVRLRIATSNVIDVDLGIPGSDPIPANIDLYHLIFDADNSARAVLKTSAIEHYDQFVVQGARRRSCFSVGFDDDTIALGWTVAEEEKYEEGAKYAASLPAATEITERRKLHAEARGADEVRDVYVRFALPDDWDGKVGMGDGTTPLEPAFPVHRDDGTTEDDPAPYFRPTLVIDQTLPLLEGVDYSGDKIPSLLDYSNSTLRERPPLVAWKLPGTTPQRWQDVTAIGRKADLETEEPDELYTWSCEVIVSGEDRSIQLHVHGEPQHILAKTDFSGQPEDDQLGEHDYRDMICTLAVTEDRHAEGRYPEDTMLPAGVDLIRRKVIDAGDRFRQDYVCPYTIVDIDESGALVRSDGGFVQDDSDELKGIARVAYEWYGTNRKVLSLATDIVFAIPLGSVVEWIGDGVVPGEGHYQQINSPLTEIRIATPRHQGDGAPEPGRMLLTTGWGELDPLQLITPEDAPADAQRPKDIVVSTFDVTRGV